MNPGLLYRTRGRWMFWIALVCSIGIHIGAVAVAKSKSESTKLISFSPSEGDIDVIDEEPEPVSPEQPMMPPPTEQLRPDEDTFPEENLTRRPVRPRKTTKLAPFARGTTASFRSVKGVVMYAPRPVYPYEARRQRITGSGEVVLTIDPTAGAVTNVVIVQSCGSIILDHATLDALRRWRFKPGTAARIHVPITYTLLGASY
jgi:TonB family protein